MDVSGRIKIGVDRQDGPVPVVYGIQLRALVVQSETSSEKVVAAQMFGVKKLAAIPQTDHSRKTAEFLRGELTIPILGDHRCKKAGLTPGRFYSF
jgi:hypothetical protein